MYLILGTAIAIFVLYLFTGKRSYLYRRLFLYQPDENIKIAFGQTEITGVMAMKKLLDHVDSKYLVQTTGVLGAGAEVIKDRVRLDKDFEGQLTIDTFRSVVHELKHVFDRHMLSIKAKLSILFWVFIGLNLITRILCLIDNSYRNIWFSVWIINLLILLLYLIFLNWTEVRAMLYVPQKAEYYLELLGIKQQRTKTVEYIKNIAPTELKWYTLTNILEGAIYFLILSFFYI